MRPITIIRRIQVFDRIIENFQVLGPIFIFFWAITIIFTFWRPQRYLNSILLMMALAVSLLFISGFLKEDAHAYFLIGCFCLVMIALFMTPVLLIFNGIQMMRRESFSLAHLLSLALGVGIGIGEIATIVYVLSLSGIIDVGNMDRWVMLLAMTVFYFSMLVLSFVIYCIFIQIMPHLMNFDYIIIHGCGLIDGEKMTKLLSNRVDKAIEIYNKCKSKPIIIPSGGQGEDEKLSEAQAMKNYLLENGIPDDSIILEDRSSTTRENLLFSKEIIDSRAGKKKTALVSSNYHIYRCLRYARELGLRCTGIGAKVAWYFWPSALIREFIAVFLTRSFFFWSMAGYLLFISPILYGLFGW